MLSTCLLLGEPDGTSRDVAYLRCSRACSCCSRIRAAGSVLRPRYEALSPCPFIGFPSFGRAASAVPGGLGRWVGGWFAFPRAGVSSLGLHAPKLPVPGWPPNPSSAAMQPMLLWELLWRSSAVVRDISATATVFSKSASQQKRKVTAVENQVAQERASSRSAQRSSRRALKIHTQCLPELSQPAMQFDPISAKPLFRACPALHSTLRLRSI